MSRAQRLLWPVRQHPVLGTFVFSLLLSWMAWSSTIDPGRDGMIYLRAAHAFQTSGLEAALAVFNWPFLSVLMAGVATLTGLSLELSAYLLNALLLAGCCALLVATVARSEPQLAGWVALSVLAVPGLNEYRGELIREFGCWCFMMLACWLALRPLPSVDGQASMRVGIGSWRQGALIQLALIAAALFRPEALALYPALLGWQLLSCRPRLQWRAALRLSGLPLLLLSGGGVLFGSGQIEASWLSRLVFDLARFNIGGFEAKAEVLASALIKYARDDAVSILLFGSLALIPLKVIAKLGVFSLAILYAWQCLGGRGLLGRYPLFGWAIGAHLLVLAIFVLDLQFLSGRYVGPTLLFSMPFIALGLQAWVMRWPRSQPVLVALALLLGVTNVLPGSTPKTQFVEAGQWLRQHSDGQRVFTDSARAVYHAGWLGLQPVDPPASAPQLQAALSSGDYALIVLEVSHRSHDPLAALAGLEFEVLARFGAPGESGLLVLKPAAVFQP